MKTCSRLSNTLRTEIKHLRLSYSAAHNRQNQWSSRIFNWYDSQTKVGLGLSGNLLTLIVINTEAISSITALLQSY